MLDVIERAVQRVGNAPGALLVAFQQVQRHALRGFAADAGQTAEGLD